MMTPAMLRAQSNAPTTQINLAGTFNDWNPADPNYRLTPIGDETFELTQFFTAGRYRFKFTFDGGWAHHLGNGPGGVLVQPGTEIPLRISSNGMYRITLALGDDRWKIEPAPLTRPHGVIYVRGPVELNIPIVLDASESVAREGHAIRRYEFSQSTNDSVRAELIHPSPTDPRAQVTLQREGDYHFEVQVDDGMTSPTEFVTLPARASYQVIGDWTATNPTSPATFLWRAGPTTFERVLKSTEPGQFHLTLVKNHDAASVLTNLTVDVPQSRPQFWRIRFDEKTNRLACEPESLVEFAYRPNQRVDSVHLAGSFNGWNPSSIPMTDRGDGTYVAYLKLGEGLYHYKFVINGDQWVPDPNADPALREDDEHQGYNSGIYVGEQGKDYGAAPTNDVNLAAVRHDPGQTRYFNVVDRHLIEVQLRTLHGDAGTVTLNVGSHAIPMRIAETSHGFDFWSANVSASGTNQTLKYWFTLADGPVTRTYEDDGKPFSASLVPRFVTPDWAKNAVWYQIFPDRFRNGTTSNDPPHTLPWRWDWYKFASWERPNVTRTFSGDWYSRRFGGDFQGVMEELPYFRKLGVTALYFCPIFESSSNHGYDTVDYRHVNRYFGFKEDLPVETLDPATWKWTASDKLFLEFLRAAHAQGLKVIIDGVFNHMGKYSFAMQDVLTNGCHSIYADWFDIIDWGPPVKYRGWGGGDWLPIFRKDPQTGIASASARQYIYNITRRWMDPNGDGNPSDGVDGWRLDVAPDVPAPFWIEWRKLVKGINPNAYIVGEDWGVATSHVQGNQWDATMNYQFAVRAVRFFIDQKRRISPSEFDRQLKELLALYPLQADFVMQNLYDSHDTDRLVSMIANPDRNYDSCNRPQDGCSYDGSKPGPAAYRLMKLMVTFQMTFLGAPMIWYGDEMGMFGADDPTCRKPMLWPDLEPYDNPQDVVMTNLWNHYARLIAIRNAYPALRTGLYESLLADDATDVFGFKRTGGGQTVAVFLNNSDREYAAEVTVPFANGARLVDLLAAPAIIRAKPLSRLGFPDFVKNGTVRALQVSRGSRCWLSVTAKSTSSCQPKKA
jgi:glycosidase